MVVLVNRFTASAAEIVAACLQDHKRAVVMGERTWGKGSVQNVIPLEHGNSALKLTTASYVRPSGKNIHRFPDASDEDDWGVTPDEGYRVELSSRDMVAMILDRRRRDIIEPSPDTADTAQKTDAADKAKQPASGNTVEKVTGGSKSPAKVAEADEVPDDWVVADRALKMAVDYLSGDVAKAD